MKNTKKLISILLLSFAGLFFITNTSLSQQTTDQLFEKALFMEEATGDLQQAIDLYQQILKDNPENRNVGARALLHMGICFEKLGLKQARGTYQDVINKYPDQQGEVAIAKGRLNRLLALQDVPFKPTFRKSPIPTELSGNLALSPDGQKLLLVSDEKLWIMPLSGNLGSDFPGKPIQLNTDSVKVSWAGFSWSGDGKSIAFNEIRWQDKPEEEKKNLNIYIVSAEGGIPKKIVENNCVGLAVNYRTSLSPDGKKLAFSTVDGVKQHIYTISTDGGVPQRLVDAQAREPVFSPDGKMIAYVEDKNLGGRGGNLWVIPASGGPSTLVAQAGNTGSPVWSPDASKIAFLDYFENKKIYIIPVGRDGKPAGEKITINAPVGASEIRQLTGWSADNKIGAIINRVKYALYTLPEQGGQAALVMYGGSPSQPRWSPDGKQIIFMKGGKRKGGWPNNKLAFVSADGGEDTNILSVSDDKIGLLPFQTGIRVSPNGKKIVISAGKHDNPVLINNHPTLQIWTIPIDGGKLIQITKPPVPYTDYSPCWSPDGKSIAFVRSKLIEERKLYGETGIYTINSSGGEPKFLTSESDAICSINWSPDGKYIAYLGKSLSVIDVHNGISKEVCKVPRWTVHTELAWSADSKRIAFNDKKGKVIKVISIDDGSIQNIETDLVNTNIFHLDWSPDGKRFVFAGYQGGIPEFWLMENFLPITK